MAPVYSTAFEVEYIVGGILPPAVQSVKHRFLRQGVFLPASREDTMTYDPISRVAIIGTGQMRPTIAVATTLAGYPTTLIGRSAEFQASKQERRGIQ